MSLIGYTLKEKNEKLTNKLKKKPDPVDLSCLTWRHGYSCIGSLVLASVLGDWELSLFISAVHFLS